MSVTVYHIGPSCVQCNQTKSLMTKLGIDFDEVDLRDHAELAEEFKKAGYLAAPVVIAGSKTWSGFKFDKIHALATRPKEEKTLEPFNCHGIEWEPNQVCLGCEAVNGERDRIREAILALPETQLINGNKVVSKHDLFEIIGASK